MRPIVASTLSVQSLYYKHLSFQNKCMASSYQHILSILIGFVGISLKKLRQEKRNIDGKARVKRCFEIDKWHVWWTHLFAKIHKT